MKNMQRALRMALKYRWSLVGSIVCSILVALFWGANLGTVYPFIEVVLHNKSLHEWVDENIETTQEKIQIAAAGTEAAPGEIRSLERKLAGFQWADPLIKQYAPKEPFDTLKLIVLFMLAGTFLRCIFLAGNMYLVARIGQRTILDLQNQVFRNVLTLEMSEIGVEGTGDLINRIRGETNSIGNAINVLFGKTIREPMKMAACLAGAAWVNWRLLLFSLVICPLALVIMVTLARKTKKANKRAMEESANLLNRLYQALAYLRIVKGYNMQQHEANRFQAVARHVYKKAMRISLYDAMSRTNNELLSVAVLGLSVLAGGYLVLNQQTHLFGIRMCPTPMDFGQVMLFFAFLIGSVDPLRKLSDVYNRLQGGIVAADRVFPIIDHRASVQDPIDPQPMTANDRSIEFRNVSFGYEPGKPVVSDVSFNLPSGSSVGIIGHNGCGKSTLISLLPRFMDAESGEILIGGVNIRDLSLHDLRDEVGFVSQMTMLFGDSVYSNISYGCDSVSEEAVRAAARQAHADSFIEQLEDGYDSQIGECGNTLSGGQKQRLSLARAILKDPGILVLDEATSQIDPESEKLIQNTLEEFTKDRTTLIVTHRMETLNLVDYILVMSEGRVVDFGTHDQLAERCEPYQKLRNIALVDAA